MEEAATNEKSEVNIDQPSSTEDKNKDKEEKNSDDKVDQTVTTAEVILPSSTEDKNKDKEEKNSDETVTTAEVILPNSTEDKIEEEKNSEDKVDQTVITPVALAGGNEPQGSVDSPVSYTGTVNQIGNQTVNVTVKYDETNQGAIDQEKEKCEPLNDGDDKDTLQTAKDVPPSDSCSELQMESAVETCTNVSLVDGKAEAVDSSEEVEGTTPTEVLAQVDKGSSEKDDGKTEVRSEKAEEGSTIIESPPSAQEIEKETPEGENEMTEAASSEVVDPASADMIDKESPKELENENTSEEDFHGAPPKLQEKDSEQSPVSAKTSEVSENTPTETRDQEKLDQTDKETLAGGDPQTIWYTDDQGNQQQGAKGYSTSVVGNVVMRKTLPSISSEPKKAARGSSTGSVFKKMSFGSLFSRKRSTKDKPNMAQQTVKDNPGHDGTDGVQENKPDDPNKESNTPVDATVKEGSQEAGEPSETTVVAEKEQDDEAEVPLKEEGEEKEIPEGAIVPLEEVVDEKEEKTTKTLDETTEQEEQKDDVETPADEDSLLRERIAKRESATPTHNPTKHMQMRMSYAEGTKEVEVLGTLEAPVQHKQDNQNASRDKKLSCRELGEVDHEGWLTKRGSGAIFTSWKRKWVVLKEQHVYYYKTSFDPEAGGVVDVKDHTITAVPEMKRRFCFKIESEDPKAAKLLFAADNQEDMDKWISVLTSASQGEVIIHKTQNQESGDVRMRKKSNSLGKRAGSVLGLGGYYSYDGDLEKTEEKRRASFGSSPTEAPQNNKPVDNQENNDRSESPSENATPSDIQKLLTTSTGDSVDASVTMETPSTAPLQEESCPPEVTTTVASAGNSDKQKPSTVESEVKISSSEASKEECPPEISPPEKTMTTPKVGQSETKDSLEVQKETYVATSSEQPPKPSQPPSPSNTTWYFVLNTDDNAWIDLEEQKAEAAKRESDELLSLVRTIKDARLSIIGTPLPGNEERARAMTNVSKQNEEVLKLREMKRSLKDKQRDLMAMEELLTKDVNRQSIHEWKTRYSYLTPEESTINEEESKLVDKKNDYNDEENESNGSGTPGGEVANGEVTDAEVAETKVDNSADLQEDKIEESEQQENGIPEHEDVQSGGHIPGDEVKKDGKSQDGGEPKDGKSEEDGNGGESSQHSKLEDSRDLQTNAKDDTNNIRLAKDDVQEKTDEANKHDLDGESAEQTIQKETNQNNNSGTDKSNLPENKVKETEKSDIDKEGEKCIDTSESLPLQDSITTRL